MKGAGRADMVRIAARVRVGGKDAHGLVWAPGCTKSSGDVSSGCGNGAGCGQEGKGYVLLPIDVLLQLEQSEERRREG